MGGLLSKVTDATPTRLIMDLQRNLGLFKEISSLFDFISLCINERENFILSLMNMSKFIEIGDSSPGEHMKNIDVMLGSRLSLCDELIEQRKKAVGVENENSDVLSELPKITDSKCDKKEKRNSLVQKEKRNSLVKRVSESVIPRSLSGEQKELIPIKKEGSPEAKRKIKKKLSQDLVGIDKKPPEKDEKKKDKRDKKPSGK